MSDTDRSLAFSLPPFWPRRVRWAALFAIALADLALTGSFSRAFDIINPRLCHETELGAWAVQGGISGPLRVIVSASVTGGIVVTHGGPLQRLPGPGRTPLRRVPCAGANRTCSAWRRQS